MSDAMTDTPEQVARLIAARYAAMTPTERIGIMFSMRRSALAIVDSSLSADLSREQRRYAIAKRMYRDELPEAALQAHARHPR